MGWESATSQVESDSVLIFEWLTKMRMRRTNTLGTELDVIDVTLNIFLPFVRETCALTSSFISHWHIISR